MRLPRPDQGGEFKAVPGGSFPAICYRVIDLGTQESSYKGKTKEQRKVMISFEIKDSDCVMDDGRPMTIHQRYTWSMFEKALLRKHLEGWRGKAFADADFDEETGFQIKDVIGKPCLIAVVQETKDGRTYSNIGGIAKLPKGMSAGQLANPTVFLSLELNEFDPAVYDGLPDRIKETIADSPEYQLAANGGGHGTRAKHVVDDEIPF